MRHTLLVVGRSSYTLLRNLIAPAKPADKTFKELVEVLSKYYSPQPTEVMQRFRFNSRSRKEGQSITDYMTELQRLVEFCNYGETDEMMQRFRFNSRSRKEGESITDYVTELRRLAEFCNYGETDEMLRDRLVWGVRDASIQKKLLGNPS